MVARERPIDDRIDAVLFNLGRRRLARRDDFHILKIRGGNAYAIITFDFLITSESANHQEITRSQSIRSVVIFVVHT